ncbi:simple sugar transport system permease protein [Amaricoccus macauensis]|uniref:Simple sugar transport system permease protein n=1 Tax=Amaricoccus macauensis TaxID=57001 RepID=A0A840SVL3_9RHOB|nr:ABC transporter permease [Amaricoccus macauensis]MBB5223846.1 simple sugar transport system permease protein [Amaricoccus macauensis]
MTAVPLAGADGLAARNSRRLASLVRAIVLPAAAVVIALACGALLLYATGFDGAALFRVMLVDSFADTRSIGETLLKAIPLILIGAGLCVAFRCGIWNIGAEGQLYAGAIAATLVGTSLHGLPPALHITLVIIAGALAGAFWAGIAGALRVAFGASEIVTTIMLNYVALFLTSWLVTGPMKDAGAAYPQSARLAREAWMPRIIPETRLHLGILVALALAGLLYVFLFRMGAGYRVRVVGTSADAARYAGMNVGRNMLLAICISGAMAGLAGAFEVAGVTRRLYQSISPGYGFEGIAVALLAGNNPLGAIASGGLFAALRSGSELLQINEQVPQVLVQVIQGIVILLVVAFGVLGARLRLRR